MVHRRKVRGPRNSVVDPPRSFASTEPFGGFETFVNVLGISTDACGGSGDLQRRHAHGERRGSKQEGGRGESGRSRGLSRLRPFGPLNMLRAPPCVLKMEPGAWGRATGIDGTIMNWSDSES